MTHDPLPITDYRLPITDYRLPMTHDPLPMTHHPLQKRSRGTPIKTSILIAGHIAPLALGDTIQLQPSR